MQRKFLFVCGVGRSGTTELARVLSAHSEIVLGVERYKRLWRLERIRRLTPKFFERESFFDFSQPFTNITPDSAPQWKRHYEMMAVKFDAATYVGDKMTQLRVRELLPAFPDAKFIVIIRNVYDVAYSWDQRAKKPSDKWPTTHDARQAVLEWSKGLRDLADYLEHFGDAVTFVEYQAFFGDHEGRELNRLLEFLDLKPDSPVVQRFAKANEVYNDRIAGKDRVLDLDVAEFIARNADLDLWNRLCPTDSQPVQQPRFSQTGISNELE